MWEGRSAAAIGLDGSLGWTRVAAAECASHIEEKRKQGNTGREPNVGGALRRRDRPRWEPRMDKSRRNGPSAKLRAGVRLPH